MAGKGRPPDSRDGRHPVRNGHSGWRARRRGWRQKDLEAKSGVSQSAISRIERGHIGPQSIDSRREPSRTALDIRVDIVPRWRGGDLDGCSTARHSALHESVARWFRDELPAWILAPEVSFSIYGERGVIDILAWHPGLRALLVIELKTDIVDVNELVGTFDRKRRLGARIAKERGWDPVDRVGLARSSATGARTDGGSSPRRDRGACSTRGSLPDGRAADRVERLVSDDPARDGWCAGPVVLGESGPGGRSMPSAGRRFDATVNARLDLDCRPPPCATFVRALPVPRQVDGRPEVDRSTAGLFGSEVDPAWAVASG